MHPPKLIRRLLMTALAVLALTLFVSCSDPGTGGPDYTVEFGGTWQYNASPTFYQRYTFTDTTCTYTSTLPMPNGTRTYSIIAVDETNHHIDMEITAQTGDFSVGPPNVGDTLYYTYSISGNVLRILGDTTSYPDSSLLVASFEYVKQ